MTSLSGLGQTNIVLASPPAGTGMHQTRGQPSPPDQISRHVGFSGDCKSDRPLISVKQSFLTSSPGMLDVF